MLSNATKSARPCAAWIRVIAAVNVVLPWSTCPIVPTYTCGLVRSNFALAMILLGGVHPVRATPCAAFLSTAAGVAVRPESGARRAVLNHHRGWSAGRVGQSPVARGRRQT